jgi:ribosomal protein L40E
MPKKIICSKCGAVLPPFATTENPKRIYKICAECEADLTRQIKGPAVEKYLETLGAPALVVNRDLRVIAYNQNCLRNLCGNESKPTGLLAGEFLECHNASLPERCGATPACLDCAIRRTAIDTLRTKESQKYVPALIPGKDGNRMVQREFLISTDKLGDMVQITIEKLVTVLLPPASEN